MNALEIEMKEITSILMNTQENFKMFEYLTSKFDDRDKAMIVYHNIYFTFTRNMLFDQIILGLATLYNPKERYNLRTFLNKFREGGAFYDTKIDNLHLKKWQNTIKSQGDIIAQVILVRNKMVAHKEEDKLTSSDLTKNNLRDLITTAQAVFQDIYLRVYSSTYMIDKPINAPVQNLDQLLDHLTEFRKASLAPLREEARKLGIDHDGNDIVPFSA